MDDFDFPRLLLQTFSWSESVALPVLVRILHQLRSAPVFLAEKFRILRNAFDDLRVSWCIRLDRRPQLRRFLDSALDVVFFAGSACALVSFWLAVWS